MLDWINRISPASPKEFFTTEDTGKIIMPVRHDDFQMINFKSQIAGVSPSTSVRGTSGILPLPF
ncbi:MAG: hypothetical protein JW774_00495 [Candidatus Aureabacteria bacterium]|nr:hypothetical protein [Candidatus Auribacterota bacterium]